MDCIFPRKLIQHIRTLRRTQITLIIELEVNPGIIDNETKNMPRKINMSITDKCCTELINNIKTRVHWYKSLRYCNANLEK